MQFKIRIIFSAHDVKEDLILKAEKDIFLFDREIKNKIK